VSDYHLKRQKRKRKMLTNLPPSIYRLIILAGDISPIDIICHIPIICEETDNPYIWVSSKDALGEAARTKRATSCVMVVPGGSKKAGAKAAAAAADGGNEEYADDYKTVYDEAKTLVEQFLLSVA
jgi:H/ACA ribonucleoprotein complex subunit 2